ncbi:hypothetical protein ZIOFF_014727 [Zingiber officinale]|uniref:Uncharacterized protein n=1 Tax=Zingiber officinale TaxID=94328 RepID=A0A8J5HHS7_ZINOF|nr:hypothetical protein ZIOFF_014727 [Zingiber officinale]
MPEQTSRPTVWCSDHPLLPNLGNFKLDPVFISLLEKELLAERTRQLVIPLGEATSSHAASPSETVVPEAQPTEPLLMSEGSSEEEPLKTRHKRSMDICAGHAVKAHQPNLYANFGQLHRALLIFANVCCYSSVVAWKSVIAHISHSCRLLEALCLFPHLHASAAPAPNSHTFSSILPACIDADADGFDSEVHALVLRNSIAVAVYVASALTDMYPKCDCVWDF